MKENMHMKQKQKNIHTQQGFTILETLIAIFILVLSLTGPLVFAQNGLRTSRLARDQVTAFLLAQDVIESIKNLRDQNGLTNQPWLTGLEPCIGDGTSCSIDTTFDELAINLCGGGICPKMKFDPISGQYSHTGPEDSVFSRTIYLREIVPDREMQIIVRIDFESLAIAGTKTIVVHENIYKWIPRLIY